MNGPGVVSGIRMYPKGPGRIRAVLAASFPSLLVAVGAARGQEPSVEAYADPPEVAVGEQFRLLVKVNGARTLERVTAPERFDFAERFDSPRPSLAVKVADGAGPESANSFTLAYALVAREPGLFEVGPFRIIADGRSLETGSVAVLVNRHPLSEPVVKTRVEPSRIHVGDDFTLTAEIFGSRAWTHEFITPDVFDLSWSIYRSGMQTETSATWILEAADAGEFVVPPLRVVAGDLTYESEPVALVIEPPRVEVEATLEARSIWVGGEFDFKLEVTGVSELDEEPAVPRADAFAELLEVDEFSHDIRAGQVRRVYGFRALRAGEFEIEPMRIVGNGRTYLSQRISVVVDEVPTGDTEPGDDIVFRVLPGRTRAYVGEPVVVEHAIGYDGRSMGPRVGAKSWPAFEDFDVHEVGWGWYGREMVVDGRRYERERLRRVALRARKSGRLELGTATVEARLWGSLAHGREETSMILTSNPHALQVLPLPEEGRPASFRGHVGTLEAVTWVDRTRAEVGETVTVRFEVSVEGLVEELPDPEIEFPDAFAVSAGEVRDRTSYRGEQLGGTRTYTYHLTAVAPGEHEIPAVEMSFFDPGTESYGTTRSHPLTVTVVPVGAGGR
ncbi:MAG: BatD family protein [Gemmatimonadota bacterium]|nr:BatD family protein [Gemmatimonadota bacterium]MDE2871043.1 BatD family protein [Gemmatimonadota bacterium]